MAFRIPGDGGDRFRQRAERARLAQEEQQKENLRRMSERISRMKEEEAWRKQEERAGFDLYLMADELLVRLERQRDENTPSDDEAEWNEKFCEAIRLIPEVRMLLEETMINMTEAVP